MAQSSPRRGTVAQAPMPVVKVHARPSPHWEASLHEPPTGLSAVQICVEGSQYAPSTHASKPPVPCGHVRPIAIGVSGAGGLPGLHVPVQHADDWLHGLLQLPERHSALLEQTPPAATEPRN